jgi:ribonuclease P protein component
MYKQVFECGRALRSAPLTVRWFLVDRECSRCGFILRKKVGDAPMRNSIRRTLRQSFVDALPRLPEGTWIIFDVANSASQGTRGSLRDQAAKLLSAIPVPGPTVSGSKPAGATIAGFDGATGSRT